MFNQSHTAYTISRHWLLMPLGADTHIYRNTNKNDFKKPGMCGRRVHMPGLKMYYTHSSIHSINFHKFHEFWDIHKNIIMNFPQLQCVEGSFRSILANCVKLKLWKSILLISISWNLSLMNKGAWTVVFDCGENASRIVEFDS